MKNFIIHEKKKKIIKEKAKKKNQTIKKINTNNVQTDTDDIVLHFM